MRVDLTESALTKLGIDPIHELSDWQGTFSILQSAKAPQQLTGAILRVVFSKSKEKPDETLLDETATWSTSTAHLIFEGTTGGDKVVQAGSTNTVLVLDDVVGVQLGEHIFVEEQEAEVESVASPNVTLKRPLESVPTTGGAVLRGFRVTVKALAADAIEAEADGYWWLFITIPGSGRQPWLYGRLDVLGTPT